jgi:hypothetical protein
MFGLFKRWSRKPDPAASEEKVIVFLNPLVMILAAAERKKGSPLTEEEVLAIRDESPCTLMPRSRAEAFYASLDAQGAVYRINPERVWEEWQAIRDQIEWS